MFVVARIFQKIGWSECWRIRAIHAERTGGETEVRSSHHTSEVERTNEICWESEQMDLDGQLTFILGHLRHKGRTMGDFDGNSGFHMRGWRLQRNLLWIDRLSPRGRVDTKTEKTDGHTRYPARTSIAHCFCRIGPDGEEHLDGRRIISGFVHTLQLNGSWRRADTNGLYHDFEETGSKTGTSTGIRLIHDGSHGGSCCPLVESEKEIAKMRYLCETWSAWLEARRLLAKSGRGDVDRLGNFGM